MPLKSISAPFSLYYFIDGALNILCVVWTSFNYLLYLSCLCMVFVSLIFENLCTKRIKRQKLNNNHNEDIKTNIEEFVEKETSAKCVSDNLVSSNNRQKNGICDNSSLQTSKLGSTSVGTMAVDSSSLSDSEDFFLGRRKFFNCSGEDLSRKLSDELILMIFRWLPKHTLVRCAFVCKRWRRIAYDESLWTRLDLSSRILKKGSLGHLLERGTIALRLAQSEIQKPVFSSSSSMSDEGVFNKLLYLDLSMTVISGEDLAQLLKTCRSLLKLSLEQCTIIQDSCGAIARNTDLEVLNMSMCNGLDESGIASILAGCKKLVEFNVAWCSLSCPALDILCREAPRTMKRLNLSGCRKSLSDDHVYELIQTCPNLMELDLSDCTSISSQSVEYLCNLKKLEHVALSRCYNITSTSYLLFSNLSSLLYLDVRGLFVDKSLPHLEQNLPKVSINKFLFSSIARPTVGVRRTSIWGLKVRR